MKHKYLNIKSQVTIDSRNELARHLTILKLYMEAS